jgi:hypothetical protein
MLALCGTYVGACWALADLSHDLRACVELSYAGRVNIGKQDTKD